MLGDTEVRHRLVHAHGFINITAELLKALTLVVEVGKLQTYVVIIDSYAVYGLRELRQRLAH